MVGSAVSRRRGMPLRLSHNAAGFSEDFDAYISRRRDVAEDVSESLPTSLQMYANAAMPP